MLAELDHGVRCDRHVGEAFRVRCGDCDDESAEQGHLDRRLCPKHPAHFRPCEKCEASNERTTDETA